MTRRGWLCKDFDACVCVAGRGKMPRDVRVCGYDSVLHKLSVNAQRFDIQNRYLVLDYVRLF